MNGLTVLLIWEKSGSRMSVVEKEILAGVKNSSRSMTQYTEVRTCMVYSFGFCVKSGRHEAVVSGSFLWPGY